MAQSWPLDSPTIPRVSLRDLHPGQPAAREATGRPAASTESAPTRSALLVRVRELVTSPVTALVVMALGLIGLFALPVVGLPFVAVVVLPVVIYQLRAEQRSTLLRRR